MAPNHSEWTGSVMYRNSAEPPPWLPQEPTGCPVGIAQQAWIEASLQWFAGQFGKEPALGATVLPTLDFLPDPYSGTTAQIADLVADVAERMSIEHSLLTLELFDRAGETGAEARKDTRAVGHYYVRDGRPVIGLDVTEASDPRYLTAVIAHELSHVRLLGENRVSADRGDQERLTDLLTVFFGFGIFTTNAALRFGETGRGWSVKPLGDLDERALNAARNDGYSRLGYLTEREFGYAMACYAWMRDEREPAWAVHLDPGPRTFLRQGLTYLADAARPGEFPTRGTGAVPVAIRVIPKIDPPWLGFPYPRPASGGWPPDSPGHRRS